MVGIDELTKEREGVRNRKNHNCEEEELTKEREDVSFGPGTSLSAVLRPDHRASSSGMYLPFSVLVDLLWQILQGEKKSATWAVLGGSAPSITCGAQLDPRSSHRAGHSVVGELGPLRHPREPPVCRGARPPSHQAHSVRLEVQVPLLPTFPGYVLRTLQQVMFAQSGRLVLFVTEGSRMAFFCSLKKASIPLLTFIMFS